MFQKFFKPNKRDAEFDIPKNVPEYFFSNFSHHKVPNYSRFNPNFQQMLMLYSSKQSFMKFLYQSQLQNIMFFYLDFNELLKYEKDKCVINIIHKTKNDSTIKKMFKLKQMINDSNQIQNNDVDYKQNESISKLFNDFDELLQRIIKTKKIKCAYINLYMKYFAINIYNSLRTTNIDVIPLIVDIFNPEIDHKQDTILSSFKSIYNSLEMELQTKLYPCYLKSDILCQYQLELLNSGGMHCLKLADFIFYEPFLVHFTEYMDVRGMGNFLSFLLSVNALTTAYPSEESTKEQSCEKIQFLHDSALEIYKSFLVPDSAKYINMPLKLTNAVANKLCSLLSSSSIIQTPASIFSDLYIPVYYFLEECWLPYFLMYENLSKYIAQSTKPSLTTKHHNTDKTSNIIKSQSNQDNLESNQSDISQVRLSNQNAENNQISNTQSDLLYEIDLVSPTPVRSPTMTLGHIDDLGDYRSCLSNSNHNTSNNTHHLFDIRSRQNDVAPDEVARQIIQEVTLMGYNNNRRVAGAGVGSNIDNESDTSLEPVDYTPNIDYLP